jgi:hypothetical protein
MPTQLCQLSNRWAALCFGFFQSPQKSYNLKDYTFTLEDLIMLGRAILLLLFCQGLCACTVRESTQDRTLGVPTYTNEHVTTYSVG